MTSVVLAKIDVTDTNKIYKFQNTNLLKGLLPGDMSFQLSVKKYIQTLEKEVLL